MPANTYRIWGWGGQVDISTEGARRIGIAGIAKAPTRDQPNKVINEIICADLGRAIRLPVPPGFLVESEQDKLIHYVSADFSREGENLPTIDARAVARELPLLSCGVIAFDLWVANKDRHEANLSFESDTKRLQIFDHGRALLGTSGISRLAGIDDADIIDSNCLSCELNDLSGFNEWSERIRELPKWFIKETVMDATRLGLTEFDAEACSQFLIKRRSSLLRIVNKNKASFVNVKQEMLPGIHPKTK